MCHALLKRSTYKTTHTGKIRYKPVFTSMGNRTAKSSGGRNIQPPTSATALLFS
jgi:hypothetical protein